MIELIVAFIVLCILLVAEWMREIHSFRITRYHITSRKLDGLDRERKVILLSDLHNCQYGAGNEKLLQAIRDEKPDMILIAGDMLVGRPGISTRVAEEFVTELSKVADTYYGNGNHEQRMKEELEKYHDAYELYRDRLANVGVIFLENEKAVLQWDGIDVNIYGLEIPYERYSKFRKIPYDVKTMNGQIGIGDKRSYNILIAHNPAYMDTYLEWGADLTVSGHLHGGVVRLPGIGGVISTQFTLFPKYSGEMKKDIEKDATSVVSKGIGLHTIKVRLFNPAEVVVMHINGAEE